MSEQGHAVRRTGHPRFYELLEEIADLHSRKNDDYCGDSDPLTNLREASDLGLTPLQGVLVRLSDKWARIKTLSRRRSVNPRDVPRVVNESFRDTLVDTAVYSLLAVILYEEELKKDFRLPRETLYLTE